jgi:2'-5' RNA ligase
VHPLVVTLALDDDAQQRLEALRRRHFPPERNVVPAHVSLFHALPGAHEAQVLDDLATACRRPAFPVTVAGVTSLGRGTALRVRAAGLASLHAELARAWGPWLTAQDRQPPRPHVTVQNKVTPEAARALQAELVDLPPVEARAVGVDVWRYVGGPWEHLRRVQFETAADG